MWCPQFLSDNRRCKMWISRRQRQLDVLADGLEQSAGPGRPGRD